MSFTARSLMPNNNNVFMMDQELNRAIENQQKRFGKTKKIKVTKEKEITSKKENVIKSKHPSDEKVYKAEQARQEQVQRVEALHRQEESSKDEEIRRLRDAMILAEIIGHPRCKDRRNRRTRRG